MIYLFDSESRRHALAAWARVRTRLYESLDGHRLPGDDGPITEARIAAEMIGLCEVALGIGHGVVLDPMLHPAYEAPPRELPDSPSIIRDLQFRIGRLEKAAFWRNLEENPPAAGCAPILPSLDWLAEARERFPHIYGPGAADTD